MGMCVRVCTHVCMCTHACTHGLQNSPHLLVSLGIKDHLLFERQPGYLFQWTL